jgi:hypothetical protein
VGALTEASCEITAPGGAKTRADFFAVKVESGKSYRFVASRQEPGSNNIAIALLSGATLVQQQTDQQSAKELNFTATATGYVTLRIAAWTTSSSAWVAPLGNYFVYAFPA